MATIKFYPHKSTGESKIYVRVLISKIDIRLSTGLIIQNAGDWSEATQRPKQTKAVLKQIKTRINELQELIEETIESYRISKTKSIHDINSRVIKTLIAEFNNDNRNIEDKNILHVFALEYSKSLTTYTRSNIIKDYKELTKYKYRNFASILEGFSKHEGKVYMISDVDVLFAKKFLDYISDIKKHVKNTQGKIIRRLKTVVKNAQQQGYRVNPDYANIKSFEDDKDIVYLTFDELDQLEAQTFDNKRIEIARDWFIISCFTAQRISDVQRLHAGLIKKIKGHNYFCFRQYKTSNYVEIPIHYKVEEVMKKYKGFPPLFTTNLDSNRSMLSKLIKEACMLSKINEKIDGQLNGKKGIFPKYKFISNQSGRQFFASNFYGVDGWSLPVVMAITGHKTEKSFMHYINQQDTSHSRTAAALFNSDKKSNQNLKAKETPHLRIVKKQA